MKTVFIMLLLASMAFSGNIAVSSDSQSLFVPVLNNGSGLGTFDVGSDCIRGVAVRVQLQPGQSQLVEVPIYAPENGVCTVTVNDVNSGKGVSELVTIPAPASPRLCVEGSFSGSGSDVIKCVDNQWVNFKTCEFGLKDAGAGLCNDRPFDWNFYIVCALVVLSAGAGLYFAFR